jgi:hypothetical protein
VSAEKQPERGLGVVPINEEEEYLARLVATRFVPGRFQGRKAMEQRAAKGNLVSLARLEVLLGLADKSAVTEAYESKIERFLRKTEAGYIRQERWPVSIEKLQRIAQEPYGKRLPWIIGMFASKDTGIPTSLVPPEVREQIYNKQRLRRLLKEASETHESAIERFLKEKLKKATRPTNIRTTNEHTRVVKIVPSGEERVSSENYGVWPARGRYPERASKHEWHISRAMLLPETRALQTQNRTRVYLTPEKRVRGGRGSALVVEVLNKTRKRPRWIVQG